MSPHGWIVVDKPSSMTSTQVTSFIKRLFCVKKAGHVGTLDPLATGVLAIALGEATKLIPYIIEGKKHYRFIVKWGEKSSTDDCQGEIIDKSNHIPSEKEIQSVLSHFQGEILQTPPDYSAVKVKGRRAYQLARQGKHVNLVPRRVTIDKIIYFNNPDRQTSLFEIICHKGTYVRSLARDLGLRLNTYGHIVSLRRLAADPFNESNAISLDYLKEIGHNSSLKDFVLPLEWALDDILAISVEANEVNAIRKGQPLFRDNVTVREDDIIRIEHKGILSAIAVFKEGKFWPKRVLNVESEDRDVDCSGSETKNH